METVTTHEAEAVFAYLEARTPFLRRNFSFAGVGGPAKLTSLRICNSLLRRLSRRHVSLNNSTSRCVKQTESSIWPVYPTLVADASHPCVSEALLLL